MKNHPSVLKLQWVEPVTLNLPWNTKFNTADSGVFLMRHMETYFGGDGLFLAENFFVESVSTIFVLASILVSNIQF